MQTIKAFFTKKTKAATVVLLILASIGGLVSINRSKAAKEASKANQEIARATKESNIAAYQNPAKNESQYKKTKERKLQIHGWKREKLPNGIEIESGSLYEESETQTEEGKHSESKPILPPPIIPPKSKLSWGVMAGIGKGNGKTWNAIIAANLFRFKSFELAPYMSLNINPDNQDVYWKTRAFGVLLTAGL